MNLRVAIGNKNYQFCYHPTVFIGGGNVESVGENYRLASWDRFSSLASRYANFLATAV
jgi:hypothetical protein